MPSQQIQKYNFVPASVNVVTTAETIVATTPKVSSPWSDCTFGGYFIVQLTHGTAATAVTLNVRRNTIAGAAIATSGALNVTAAQIGMFSLGWTDAPAGEVTGFVWVLTVTYTAATGNSTGNNAFASVIVAE